MSDKKHILAKMHAIMKAVPYIKKDARNTFQGYTYASEKAIKETLHKLLVEHGVLFLLTTKNPKIIDLEVSDKRPNQIPKATIIECVYTFTDVETGEYMCGEFVASGPARDDKGLWAATTNAIKYILTSTFLIPTGDDAESDKNHPPPNEDCEQETAQPSRYQQYVDSLKAKCREHHVTPPKTVADIRYIGMTIAASKVAKPLFDKGQMHTQSAGKDEKTWTVIQATLEQLTKTNIEQIMKMLATANERNKK